MSWVMLYLGVALINCARDGSACYIARRRFEVWGSLLSCIFWPITAPMEIAGAAIATKNYPKWDRKIAAETSA